MKMRGIHISLEHIMVPLLMSAVNVSEELSAAALCRGLDSPEPHTSLVQVRFHFSDILVWCVTGALAITAAHSEGGGNFMISFQNVTFSYQENGEPKSLDSINLEVNNGECILLCGKSGCGKTTMTRLLNGMIPNFYEGKLQGTVLLDGQSLFDLPMYEISKQVGSVFQNPRTQFYTVNTTSEIAFGCENLGMESQKIARCIEQTAEDLQIKYLLNRNIFNLSGGEKQIIAFASIYAMSPQVYVLDEPSSNLRYSGD